MTCMSKLLTWVSGRRRRDGVTCMSKLLTWVSGHRRRDGVTDALTDQVRDFTLMSRFLTSLSTVRDFTLMSRFLTLLSTKLVTN